MKHHNCSEAQRIARKSHKIAIKDAAKSQGYDIENVSIKEGENYSCKPVQLILTERLDVCVCQEILDGLKKMSFANLDLKVINKAKKGMFASKELLMVYGF